MSTTHADTIKGRWHRRKFYIDRGFIKPVPGWRVDDYNPFDFYRPGERDNLHYIFASLDLGDEAAIEGFCSRFGLLGFFNRKILKIVSDNPSRAHRFNLPGNSPYAGVQKTSRELMSMDELIETFHIPEEKFPKPKEEDDVVIPNPRITVLDTWESVKDFQEECTTFRWIMDLQDAISEKDIPKIRELFHNRKYGEVDKDDDTSVLLSATVAVMWAVNGELENMVSPSLAFDDSSSGISKNITWRCDSLLTSLYMMIFLDITRGVLTKRCEFEKCRRYFEASGPEVKYCTPSCQTRAKTKRYRDKQKETEGGFN